MILREAFLEALYATARLSGPSHRGSSSPGAVNRKATDLIAASQFDHAATRNRSSKLIYLQALILMILEAEGRGPASQEDRPGPLQAVWLGSAVGLAYHLRLYSDRSLERSLSAINDDLDSDDCVGRRSWWVLVMLDRWHASSRSSPLFIPDSSINLLPEDRQILGDAPFHLVRTSHVLRSYPARRISININIKCV